MLLGDPAAASVCQSEALAAFERLATSGRPYRRDQMVGNSRLGVPQIEVIPPDRMRSTTDSSIGLLFSTVRVGKRLWLGYRRGNTIPWEEAAADHPIRTLLTLSNTEVEASLSNLTFECLGTVAYSGESFIGYKALYSVDGAVTGENPRGVPWNFPAPNQPTLWLTLFVDPHTSLVAYEIAAEDGKLDKPKWITRYTYSTDIVIEPPVP